MRKVLAANSEKIEESSMFSAVFEVPRVTQNAKWKSLAKVGLFGAFL